MKNYKMKTKYKSKMFGGILCLISLLFYFLLESELHFISGALLGIGFAYLFGLIQFKTKT